MDYRSYNSTEGSPSYRIRLSVRQLRLYILFPCEYLPFTEPEHALITLSGQFLSDLLLHRRLALRP